MDAARRYFLVSGRVQGVGYRYFARRAAQSLGLSGWVRNLDDGGVEAEAQGSAQSLVSFEGLLREGPPGGHVRSLDSRGVPLCDCENDFAIRF